MKIFGKITLFLLTLLAAATVWAAGEKSQTIVYVNGAKYYIHMVSPGETIYSLSKLYGVSDQVLMSNNPALKDGLKAGQSLKIPFVGDVKPPVPDKKLKRKFDIHYVAAGETLYAISRRYEISVDQVLEDNPELDPLHMSIGTRVLVRKSEMGETSASQSLQELEEYKDNLNKVSDEENYSFHLVHAGETLYALSHRFGISEEEIVRINNLTDGLKTGSIIKLPSAGSAVTAQPDDDDDPNRTQNEKWTPRRSEVFFTAVGERETLETALLLPLSASNNSSRNYYVEFYQGFLLGLEDVKAEGHSVNLTLFDTGHDYNKTAEIVSDPQFRNARLIVGPVYEDELLPVLQFAEQNSVPVVSPLANITDTGSSVLFQMSPDPVRKHEKLRRLLDEGKHVTLIYTDHTDREFEEEVLSLLGARPYATHKYTYVHHSAGGGSNQAGDLTPLLHNGRDNVFVVMADNETEVDRVLAAIASADAGLTSRGHVNPKFMVLGNSKWLRYSNIDRSMFFKDRVMMVSTYHAKRDSDAVRKFDSRFVEAFGALPSLYAYRGYDVAVIFCNGMYSDIEYKMEGRRFRPLQTAYKFETKKDSGMHINREWIRVTYGTDYTIKAE